VARPDLVDLDDHEHNEHINDQKAAVESPRGPYSGSIACGVQGTEGVQED
jgi:hypothetical protein